MLSDLRYIFDPLSIHFSIQPRYSRYTVSASSAVSGLYRLCRDVYRLYRKCIGGCIGRIGSVSEVYRMFREVYEEVYRVYRDMYRTVSRCTEVYRCAPTCVESSGSRGIGCWERAQLFTRAGCQTVRTPSPSAVGRPLVMMISGRSIARDDDQRYVDRS